MSYRTFPDKPVLHVGDLADPAQMNACFDGIQAELEDRTAAALLDGVAAGLACTIHGTAVDIAVGQAYVSGLLFTGGASLGFGAEEPAGTYYICIDPSNLAAPYTKSQSPPGAGKLALCSVRWDGSGLSDLADLRPLGLKPACLRFSIAGAVSAGPIAYGILDRDLWVEDVQMMLAQTGSAGQTVVDVHIGNPGGEPTSIFTDQSRRPSIESAAPSYSLAVSGPPDTNRQATAGQVLRVDVDAAATEAAGLGLIIRARYL